MRERAVGRTRRGRIASVGRVGAGDPGARIVTTAAGQPRRRRRAPGRAPAAAPRGLSAATANVSTLTSLTAD